MPSRAGSRNKKTLEREAEERRRAAIDAARKKAFAGKDELDPAIAIDSLAILEEVMRHFYFKARILEGLGAEVDWKLLDQAWEQVGKWAKEVATFRHAKIAAVKLAGDPNEPPVSSQTIEELKRGLIEDLSRLRDVIDLKAIPAPEGIENYTSGRSSNSEDESIAPSAK